MSQSPSDAGSSRTYRHGWSSLRRLILDEGASLSGRERNVLYLNLGDGTFADVSSVSAADASGDGRALAITDWDDDGRLDLLLCNRTAPRLQLFRNLDSSGGHFLALDLEGVACNRDAIGARVVVEAGGRTLHKTLYAGDGFLAQSSKRLHFGLGDAERVERLTVRWPDGSMDSFTDLEADTRFVITQGSSEPVVSPARTITALAEARPRPTVKDTRGMPRLALLEKIPLAPVRVPAFDEPERTIGDLGGGPVLLTLWATTCPACLKEFQGFREQADEMRAAGLRIVTLCTDPESEFARARAMLEHYGLDADAGRVDDDFLAFLQVLFTNLIGSQEDTPLPTSLLLDSAGQLAAVYFGPVYVDELLDDVEVLRRTDPDDLADVRLTTGKRVVRRNRNFGRLARELVQIGQEDLARFYRRVGQRRDKPGR